MKSISLQNSKLVATVVGLGLAASLLLGVSVQVASAQSFSIAQLLQILVAAGVIAPDKLAAAQAAVSAMGATSASSGHTFSTNLTVGSTGADVTALQNALGVSPATGYFGAITKAAVVKYQAANGLPATGYVGALTRAKLDGSTTTTTTTTTTNTNTNTNTTVTNTGVEGILTVNLNPSPSSGQTVYAGDMGDAILGVKLQAQLSPITIQRVQLNLGSSSNFYTKFFQNLYLVSDTGQVLAQAALNSNTVTKQTSSTGNTYLVTFSGFNYTVPGDNSVHVLTVKGDLYGSIDSTYNGTTATLTIDASGIRGTDGAGIDQYAPASSISNSVTLQGALSDSASLQISTDASNPFAQTIVANSGASNDEVSGVTVLVFDAYAQKSNVQIDNLMGTTTMGATYTTGAYPVTAYLYDGSTQIGSSAITCVTTSCTFDFTNVNYVIPSNTTKALTVKEDFKHANTTAVTATTAISTGVLSELVAETSPVGNTLAVAKVTGSATGNTFTSLSQGPVFTLVGTPTFGPATTVTGGLSAISTTTASASFTVDIKAVGANLYFGTQAASSTFVITLYKNGSVLVAVATDASSTSWYTPSSGVVTTGLPGVSGGNNQFELQQNNEVQVPVTYSISNRDSAGVQQFGTGDYSAQISAINWSLNGISTLSSTFMKGQSAWRTSNTVHLP
jgi:peptidoglycan hydrolase-like protein with peptidoglycan-binding domain